MPDLMIPAAGTAHVPDLNCWPPFSSFKLTCLQSASFITQSNKRMKSVNTIALGALLVAVLSASSTGVAADTKAGPEKAEVRTLLRRAYADLTTEDVVFEKSLRGLAICSPKGEKAVQCGADRKKGRGDYCCGQLKCGGDKDRYCVKAGDDEDDNDKSTCSPEDEKSEYCGADAKKGRGKFCCKGLKCGGEKDRYCVKDKDTDEDEKDDDDGDGEYEAPDIDRSGDKSLGFVWHLWYEPGIKWAPRGYDFCVMCRNLKCEKNDYVVTSHCNANEDHFRWEYIEVEDGVGLMKTKTENLCLEGNKKWDYILRPCEKKNDRQHFKGLDEGGKKFQLLPKEHQRKNNPLCMTMLHHPLAANDKDGEQVIDQLCYKAERTETAYWTVDYRPRIKDELKKADKKCSKEKCGECKGYCEKDSDCKGDLYCYERGGKGWRTNLENKYDPNPWAQIPGCTGYGRHGKNYCSKKKYKSPYSDKEIKDILDKN